MPIEISYYFLPYHHLYILYYHFHKYHILDYFDRKIVTYGNDLLEIQNEIEKVSKPAPVGKWRLVFVFSRANVEVVGQAAKNLYEELLAAKSDLNLKMHVKETNQTKYETKFALIVDSYEIL